MLPGIPTPPSVDEPAKQERKIGDTALWDLAELIAIAENHREEAPTIRTVTYDAERDLENLQQLGFDFVDVLKKVAARGNFKGAWWCKTSPAKDRHGRPRGKGAWIPCDAYTLIDEYYHPTARKTLKAEYYLKMSKALDGTTVYFVSIHV